MTTQKFKISPLAIAREGSTGTEVRLAVTLEFEELEGEVMPLANMEFSDHGRSFGVQEIIFQHPDEWTWIGIEGAMYTARAIRPSDAALADVWGYDLPEAVLAAIAYGTLENPMQLQAIVDEDTNRVMTLMLSSDAGLYARYDTLWHPVTDPEVFGGAYIIDVTEDAIQLYDAADSVGAQIAAAALPTGKNETNADIPLPVPSTPEVAQPTETTIPVISNEDELAEAITAAAVAPEMRWYVESRARAMGVDVEFPW